MYTQNNGYDAYEDHKCHDSGAYICNVEEEWFPKYMYSTY